ncbi:Uncharacterised protein [Vibrio cholerae]|nr:Uncharacterised protein [Vibrio cholerae]
MTELTRQAIHIFLIHIRWIGHNQVILLLWQITEQIGTDRENLLF